MEWFWFIEDQAFLPSYDLAPLSPPYFVSKLDRRHSLRMRNRDSLLTGDGRSSQIIPRRESLVFNKLNTPFECLFRCITVHVNCSNIILSSLKNFNVTFFIVTQSQQRLRACAPTAARMELPDSCSPSKAYCIFKNICLLTFIMLTVGT